MCCNWSGTGSVPKQTERQTVISIATQLSCHPVRQTCIAVIRRPTSQRLIKVDGLGIKIQRQKMKIGLIKSISTVYAIHCNDI